MIFWNCSNILDFKYVISFIGYDTLALYPVVIKYIHLTFIKIGSLAGYPIDGQYYTGLTVRKGACRFVMGWKCSQGDSVKESAELTADTLFEGLVDSIGGVNSG